MNVRGRRWVDFALGGLNYQIEHHLFPSMPRPNLRRAQPIVQSFCVARDIRYSQCGLLRSYGHVLHHLHAAGATLRAAPPSEMLSDATSSHPGSLLVPQETRSILITGGRKEQYRWEAKDRNQVLLRDGSRRVQPRMHLRRQHNNEDR